MINCTLVIQAVHFGVIWLLLQRFLWPQLLAAYDAQSNSLQQLGNAVQKGQQNVRLAQEHVAAEWSRIAQACRRAAYNEAVEKPFVVIQPTLQPQPSEQELRQQIDRAVDALVKKVLDA